MIKWYPDLYLDSITRKQVKKIKRKMEQGRKTVFYYCIALASNPNNLFDIIYTDELLFHYYRSKEIYIIGLASSRESAVHLVKDIVTELYENTGRFDARTYFQSTEIPVKPETTEKC